jgi:hypothetical protein
MKRIVLSAVAVFILGISHQSATAQSGSGFSGSGAHFNLGILGGYGFQDGYNIGFGARAGFSFEFLYVGALAMVHTGESGDVVAAAQSVNVKTDVIYYAAEVGLNLGTIRPSLLLGAADFDVEANQTLSETKFMLGPGVTLFFPLGQNFYIGGDARAIIVGKDDFGDVEGINDIESNYDNPTGTVFALYATIGYTF